MLYYANKMKHCQGPRGTSGVSFCVSYQPQSRKSGAGGSLWLDLRSPPRVPSHARLTHAASVTSPSSSSTPAILTGTSVRTWRARASFCLACRYDTKREERLTRLSALPAQGPSCAQAPARGDPSRGEAGSTPRQESQCRQLPEKGTHPAALQAQAKSHCLMAVI